MSLSNRKQKSTNRSLLTPFHEGAQYFIEKYFHKVYPETETKPDPKKISRLFHGGLHACCTVMAADLLIVMIKEHFTYHETHLKEYNADPELRELFRYGVLFHDIGNRQENDRDTEMKTRFK